jgi:hypothetical protein
MLSSQQKGEMKKEPKPNAHTLLFIVSCDSLLMWKERKMINTVVDENRWIPFLWRVAACERVTEFECCVFRECFCLVSLSRLKFDHDAASGRSRGATVARLTPDRERLRVRITSGSIIFSRFSFRSPAFVPVGNILRYKVGR